MKKMFAVSSLMLSFSGCVSVGEQFSSNVKWIVVNQTNREQVITHFGQPFRHGYDSGLLTYTYGFYRYSLFKPFRSKDLTIRFHPDGRVHSYTFASSFEDDKVDK